MKPLRNTILAIIVVLALPVGPDTALSAEQSGNKSDAAGAKGSSKSLAQTVEEIRNSINEGWRKLTSPKTVEPARNKVNEAYKELSDAAGAALGSSKKSQKDNMETKSR